MICYVAYQSLLFFREGNHIMRINDTNEYVALSFS